MTRRGFAAELARSGSDLAAWPAAAREAALALLERSGAARAIFARALHAEAAPSAARAAAVAVDNAADNALGERLLVPLRATLPSLLSERRLAPRRLRPPMLGWGTVAAAVALGLWLGGAGMGAAPGPSPDLFASAQLAPLGAYQP